MNVGTPLYMAPESLKKNYYSCKSDLYAIGIVLFEMLVGRTPHEVENEKELIDRLNCEIIIPKFFKNPKVIEFVTKACQMNEAKRLSKEEFETFDFGVSFTQQSSLAHSLNNCSSMLSLKDRKTSLGGTATDDSVSKNKDSFTNRRTIGSNSLSKDPSR
jgi:serine/threonine protein kinase